MSAGTEDLRNQGNSFFSFAKDGFAYNLQVLPDVLMSATLLFSVLFQSPPMVVFGVAMMLVQFIHKGLAAFSAAYLPDMSYNPADYNKCSGRFPGAAYGTAMNYVRNGIFGVRTDGWPSYYSTFIGFLVGWIGALPTIYSKELDASPEKKAASAAGLIILVFLTLLIMVYRITSDCEGFLPVSLGLLAGFGIGLLLVILTAWVSDRRGTNILGLPLIRNKVANGQPIYVCERSGGNSAATE